jgi:flavin-dependent dehydrogenase
MKIAASSDVLIAGGGLGGAAAAIVLARAGRSVVLIEKESRSQHKVCGEFLSQEALSYLHALGVDVVALGAVPITAVRLTGRFGVSESLLPFAALSLTRLRLDAELLGLAEAAGATILRGRTVQALERTGDRWQAELDNETLVSAGSAFLATGKHDLHDHQRPRGRQGDLIAFKMYWKLAPEQSAGLNGHVELLLYRGGYGGLQPVEAGAANLCCLVQRDEYLRAGGRWSSLLAAMRRACPHLDRRLSGAEPLLSRPLAVSSIPYGLVREPISDLWVLGDQAVVIPSFTGDGMSIALHSGCLAAEMLLCGETPESFQQRLRCEVERQVSFATTLSLGLVAQPHGCGPEPCATLPNAHASLPPRFAARQLSR